MPKNRSDKVEEEIAKADLARANQLFVAGLAAGLPSLAIMYAISRNSSDLDSSVLSVVIIVSIAMTVGAPMIGLYVRSSAIKRLNKLFPQDRELASTSPVRDPSHSCCHRATEQQVAAD